MYPIPQNAFISKVLVPVLYGCEQKSAIHAAHSIAGDENVLLTGFIYVPEDQSLSTAAVDARKLRKTLKQLYKVKRGDKWAQVNVSHNPWNDLVEVVRRENVDLLLLEWPCHFDSLKVSVAEALFTCAMRYCHRQSSYWIEHQECIDPHSRRTVCRVEPAYCSIHSQFQQRTNFIPASFSKRLYKRSGCSL